MAKIELPRQKRKNKNKVVTPETTNKKEGASGSFCPQRKNSTLVVVTTFVVVEMEWKCKASFEKRSFLLSLRGPELVLLLTLEVVTIFVVVEMEWKCKASFEKCPFLLP